VDQYENFFSGGHLNDEGVSLYVDALKLDRVQNLPQMILSHVEDCHRCKQEITGLFSLLAEADYSNTGPHPFFEKRTAGRRHELSHLYRIAATILLVVGLGVAAYWVLLRRPGHETRASRAASPAMADSLPRAGNNVGEKLKEELIAARYAESPELEDLLKSAIRSEETEIKSPTAAAALRRGDKFHWVTSAKPPYELVLLNNRDSVLSTVRITSTTYLLKDSLVAGLYYWKLIGEGNLLHVGKFIVR
jgi:hypothetical protein